MCNRIRSHFTWSHFTFPCSTFCTCNLLYIRPFRIRTFHTRPFVLTFAVLASVTQVRHFDESFCCKSWGSRFAPSSRGQSRSISARTERNKRVRIPGRFRNLCRNIWVRRFGWRPGERSRVESRTDPARSNPARRRKSSRSSTDVLRLYKFEPKRKKVTF